MNGSLYFSLDEARDEIKKRWNNQALRKKIEDELKDKFIPQFKDNPRGVTFRQLCSPDNGFTLFFQCSKYLGVEPLIVEFLDDIFVSFNEEKKGLGRLRLIMDNRGKGSVNIMNFHDNEKKKLRDCVIKSGEKLVNFHHNLFKILGYKVDVLENSEWFRNIGTAKDYYYYFFLHFIAHGVLFETYFDEGGSNEDQFTNEVIKPIIKKIEEKIGMAPIIVRSYPANQNDEEDFYWWSYPPHVNKYLVEYIQEQKIHFKTIK